jgi:hypothetical protein
MLAVVSDVAAAGPTVRSVSKSAAPARPDIDRQRGILVVAGAQGQAAPRTHKLSKSGPQDGYKGVSAL